MLKPNDPRLLLEALRPPDGFAIDRVLATTFTLDLTALLTAPLAFSMFDGVLDRADATETHKISDRIDPLALLRAVRAHAEQITVFCQATRMGSSGRYRRLLTYLEGSVVEVVAPNRDGVFHPKVWVVRLRGEDGAVRYRVLCSTRNLTFDTSWDTMLALDGELTDRTKAFSENRPLAGFIGSLPGLARAMPPESARQTAALMAKELLVVRFELPEGFESLQFHVFGLDGEEKWPFPERAQRTLVVSPFVRPKTLEKLGRKGQGDVLLSRIDELEAIEPAVLQKFAKCLVLADAAHLEEVDQDADTTPAATSQLSAASGLHAKLYVLEQGWDAHVFTGSANATGAAFEGNVEFLVELVGKKSQCGIDVILEKSGFRELLAEYTPKPAQPLLAESMRRLEDELQKVRLALTCPEWVAVIGPPDGEAFQVQLEARKAGLELPGSARVSVRPAALAAGYGQALRSGPPGPVAKFTSSMEGLTSFFEFSVAVHHAGEELDDAFYLNVRLENAPPDRSARVLESMLDDPQKLLRFLRILLAVDVSEVLEAIEAEDGSNGTGNGIARRAAEEPVFEMLLQALERDPSRLDAVAKTLAELASTPTGQRAFPPDFAEIWEPIRAAHLAQQATRSGRVSR
jgi:hypothetical protein